MIVVDQFLDLGVPLPLPAGIVAVPARVAGLGGEVIEVLVLRDWRRRRARRPCGPVLSAPWLAWNQVKLAPRCSETPNRRPYFLAAFCQSPTTSRLRAHVHGVPLVQLRVPEEEVVVVRAHAHEVLGPGLLVELHQAIGIPLLGLPQGDDVLVAELRGVAVMLEVVLVVLAALLVHAAGVPVAVHGHGLRTPVGPDAELGVAEPVRTLVLLERIHRRLERPVGNRRVDLIFAVRGGNRDQACNKRCRKPVRDLHPIRLLGWFLPEKSLPRWNGVRSQ